MLGTILEAIGFLGSVFGSQGQKDKPDLKDEDGNWLPLHYMQHARAEAGDLESIYKDGHTVCHNDSGVPVGRWSPSLQVFQPVTGFTIQGLPVYEDVPSIHPVWTTRRAVPAHLGTPGSDSQIPRAKNGGSHHYTSGPVRVLRGEKLAAALGSYGPLGDLKATPPGTGERGGSTASGGGSSGVLLIGAAVLAAAGMWIPAALVAGVGVLGAGVISGGGTGRGTSPRH